MAEKFVLAKNGNVYGSLSVDADGTPGLFLRTLDNGSSLLVKLFENTPRALIAVLGPDGKPMLSLHVTETGVPLISMQRAGSSSSGALVHVGDSQMQMVSRSSSEEVSRFCLNADGSFFATTDSPDKQAIVIDDKELQQYIQREADLLRRQAIRKRQ